MTSDLPLPLITIGLTCYNAADTITRAVNSAIDQTWSNREILIVDDCSTDNSWSILEDLAQKHGEVKIFRCDENAGYAAALNMLITRASGEFIAFFDDDDVSSPERLVRQHARLTSYESHIGKERILCYTNRNVVEVGESTAAHVRKAIGRHDPEPHGPIVADYIFGIEAPNTFCWGAFGSCTLMSRRNTLLELAAFDASFRRFAEWDFAIRAAFSNTHFISVDASLVTQYKTVSSDKAGPRVLSSNLQVCQKHRLYLSSRDAYGGALALAHVRFHSSRGELWRARAWYLFAIVRLPWRLARRRISDSAYLKGCLSHRLDRSKHPMNSALLRPIDVRRHNRASILSLLDTYAKSGSVVYDIGCGDQPFAPQIRTLGCVYRGVDIAQGFYNEKPDIIGTATDVPAPDSTADVVILSQVLEHLDRPFDALQEAHRLLRTGGVLLCSYPFLYPIHAPPYDFGRYTRYYIASAADRLGYKIVSEESLAGFWRVSGMTFAIYAQGFDRGILRHIRLIPLITAILQWICVGLHSLETFVWRLAGKSSRTSQQNWPVSYVFALKKQEAGNLSQQ